MDFRLRGNDDRHLLADHSSNYDGAGNSEKITLMRCASVAATG